MFKPRTSFKDIILGIKNVATNSDNFNSLKLDKVLILSKLSRYEFEKQKYNIDNDLQLEKELRTRGADFETLIRCHDIHKKFESTLVKTMQQMGINIEVINRLSYTVEKVNWADVVMPVGGDGTFLLAASKIRDNAKPVIGFNSDPTRSEGHLCLHKKYSANVRKALEKLQKGEFDWLLRSRIRIKMIYQSGDINPKPLHEMQDSFVAVEKVDPNVSRVLPVLALNEVFVGETTSSRVSHIQIRLNGSIEQTSIKCSGVCVCTGTGSTSWHLSINRIPAESVADLLRFGQCASYEEAQTIADLYNKSLIFRADDKRMCYTIRDLISAGVWPFPKGIKPRDFVSKIELKSNCYDASLVVDGGVSFDFNDGTIALLESKLKDSLRTVVLRD